MASSSTTEPCASCNRFLIVIFVRPSSTAIWTGMSRIMSSSFIIDALPSVSPKAGKICAGCALAPGAVSEIACSAIAAAQSSSTAPGVSLFVSLAMLDSRSGFVALRRYESFDFERVLPALLTVVALHQRNIIHFCNDFIGDAERDDVTGFHLEDVTKRDGRGGELSGNFNFGIFKLPA